MQRSPLPTSDPADIRAWRERSQRARPLRAVGFTVTIHDGEADGEAPQRPRQKVTGFPAAVKLAARARAGHGDPDAACCEACGLWLGRYRGEIQHRIARGMGGTSLGITNSIINAAALCGSGAMRTGCHGLCEDRDDNMHHRGFWLKSGQDPVTEPIEHAARGTVYLLIDGTYSDPEPDGNDAA